MNFLFHLLFNIAVLAAAFGKEVVQENLVLVSLFSIVLDIDHLPYAARNWRRILSEKRFPIEEGARSRFHELFGVMAFSLAFSLAGLVFPGKWAVLSGASVILHLAVDFVLGESRPFYPFSKDTVRFFKVQDFLARLAIQGILTSIAGGAVFFLWQ